MYNHRSEGLADPSAEPARAPAPGKVATTSKLAPRRDPTPGEASNANVQLDAAARDPLQLSPDEAHVAALSGIASASQALPHQAAIQASFGHHDVGGVRAAVGGAAADASAALGARAYATGDTVAFASSPDLHLAAHEAAHVVQQRGGVRLSDGLGRAGDQYEQHADAVADRVVRGESAESLLDTMAHRGASGGAAVQRAEGTATATSTATPAPATGTAAGASSFEQELETPYGKIKIECAVKVQNAAEEGGGCEGEGEGEGAQSSQQNAGITFGTQSSSEGTSAAVTGSNAVPALLRKIGLEVPGLTDSLNVTSTGDASYSLGFAKPFSLGPIKGKFTFNLLQASLEKGKPEFAVGTMAFTAELPIPLGTGVEGVVELTFELEPEWSRVASLVLDGELAAGGATEVTEGAAAVTTAGETGAGVAAEAGADAVLVGEVSAAAAAEAAAVIMLAPAAFWAACLVDLSESDARALRMGGLSNYRGGYKAALIPKIFPTVPAGDLSVSGTTAEQAAAMEKAMRKGIADGGAAYAKLDPTKVQQLRASGASDTFREELEAKLMETTGDGW